MHDAPPLFLLIAVAWVILGGVLPPRSSVAPAPGLRGGERSGEVLRAPSPLPIGMVGAPPASPGTLPRLGEARGPGPHAPGRPPAGGSVAPGTPSQARTGGAPGGGPGANAPAAPVADRLRLLCVYRL